MRCFSRSDPAVEPLFFFQKKRKRSEQKSTAKESIEGSRAHGTYTRSLKLLLLGKIHGLYLQALAKLPRDGLRKRNHCSLLKCGYCNGPRDPVSNIILNTIWYGSMFPTPQEFELQFKYALWYLFSSDADVHKATRKGKKHGHAHAVCEGDNHLHNAYRKAVVASWHPDPEALVKFAMSSLNMESAELLAMLQQGTLTNGAAVECLAMALPPTKAEDQQNQVVTSISKVLCKQQNRFISEF
ncbi:hypothetical protein ACQ4PT_060584 [Festuca glaucescens]